jgi:hypothetical protein
MFARTRERENGKVKQKTLRNVATVFPEDVDHFLELTKHIRAEMEVSVTAKSIHSTGNKYRVI